MTAAIAEQGGLLGEITTVRLGEGDTIRDITIETSDQEHTRRLVEIVRHLDGVDLLETLDPVLIDALGPEQFVETVLRVALSFGAVHLEDIRTPDCFLIEEKLLAELDKPVFHDDQHGTATAALAAIINACRLTGLDLREARLG